MKKLAAVYLAIAALAVPISFTVPLVTGCVSTQVVGTNTLGAPVTNTVTTLDTNKLSKIERALEPIAASGIRRALVNSPQHSDEIALYMRGVGGVFCDMQARGQLDPATAIAGIDALALPKLSDGSVLDIKNGLIAIYQIAWDDRWSVQMPANQWASQVASLICDSIDRGLKDAGKAGVK